MPSNTESLDDILAAKCLRVPDYQRGYAWEEQQLDEFWEDLSVLQPGGKHYTGTLVLQPKREDDQFDDARQINLEGFDVVDGQQRLTTCFMLLDRIFDRLEALGDPDTPGDRKRLLIMSNGGVKFPKLRLGEDIRRHWADVILEGQQPVAGPRMAAERRLSEGAEFFERQLTKTIAGCDEAEMRRRLRELAGKVVNGLQFSLYRVEDGSEVGTIFETVNQRGKDLSELEKVKNYLLFLASLLSTFEQRQSLSDTVNEAWKGIFSDLVNMSSRSEDQLLRAHWLAYTDPNERLWENAKSIKRRFHRGRYVSPGQGPVNADRLISDVSVYADSLRRAARAYRDLLEDKDDGFSSFGDSAEELRKAARNLRQSQVVAPFAPLLIVRGGDSDAEGLLRLLKACEVFSARIFMICGYRSNAGQARLYTLAHELHASGDYDLAIKGVYERVGSFANDGYTRTELLNERKNWYRKPAHKYFLFQYELALLKGRAPQISFETLISASNRAKTTEHILPQTPTDDCWNSFSDEQREHLTHALGNLVLTYDNSVYSNFCFSRKRDGQTGAVDEKSYGTSTLLQEKALKRVTDWNPEALLKRQRELAEWALERWPLPAGTVAVAGTTDEAEAVDAFESERDPMLDVVDQEPSSTSLTHGKGEPE